MKPLRVGISLLHLLPGGIFGSEIYVRNLLSALAREGSPHEYVLFTNTDNHGTFEFADGRFRRVLCRVGARPQSRRVAYEQLVLPRLATRHRLDVLHSPGYTAPLAAPCARVVSILDMLYRVHPGIIPQPKRLFWQTLIPLSARRCHAVLTISESSRRDIVRFLGLPAGKIVVTPLSLDQTLVDRQTARQARPGPAGTHPGTPANGPYVFTLTNSITGHKNLRGLLSAFTALHRRLPEVRLVVGGGAASEAEARRAVEELGLAGSVLLLGYLSPDDMVGLYENAAAYVIPSLFEGFGLPALEAMHFGVPLASSRAGSLPEIIGDAGVFFDPRDSSDMADALHRVLTDQALRQDLVEKGRRRLAEFSWEKTARMTLSGYEQAVREKNH